MATARAKIADPVGLHLRAASRIVKLAKRFESDISIAYGGVEANAKSILGLATLQAHHLEELEIRAAGPDEAAALEALVHLISVELAEEA